jgi:tetratricopeptide (TPR) repeat protein
MSRVGQICEQVVESGWLVALATVPLYFDVFSSRVFEPDKIILFRCLVLVMLAAAAVASVDAQASVSQESTNRPGIRGVLRSPWLKANPIARPVALLFAAELLATVTSIAPLTSVLGSYQRLQGTYTLLSYVAFFFLIAAYLRRSEQLDRLIRVVLLTTVPICLYGVAQHLNLDPLSWGGDVMLRVTSTMGNAIFLAAYLIMVIPLTAARLIAAVRRADSISPAPNDNSTTIRWGLLILFQNVAMAIPLVLQTGLLEIWWAATGFIGLFVLVAVVPIPVASSRATLRLEAAALGTLLVLQVGCLLLTQSRGPWLGLFVGAIAFVLLIQFSSGLRRAVLVTSLTVVVAALGFLVVFNVPNSPLAAYRAVPYLGRLGQLTDVGEGTGRVRVLIWQGTAELLKTHPTIGLAPDPLSAARLLVGYGPETMPLAYSPVYPPALGDLESRYTTPDRNHNDPLDHLLMTGVLGLLAYVAVVVGAFRVGWLVVKRATSFEERLLPIGLMAALTAHLAETQTGIAIVSTKTYFWTILALLVTLYIRPTLIDVNNPSEAGILGQEASAARQTLPHRSAAASDSSTGTGQRSSLRPYFRLISQFAGIVAMSQLLLIAIALPHVGGVPSLVYGSFLWLLLAVFAIAFLTIDTLSKAPVSALTLRTGFVAVVVVLVGAWFNLNQLAADVYLKQGNGLDTHGHIAESVVAFRQAVNLAPYQAFYAVYLGRAYLELAGLSTDLTPGLSSPLTLSSVLSDAPSPWMTLSKNDAYESARVIFEYARDVEPLNPDHYGNLARLYRLWGESKDTTKLELSSHYSEQATTLSPHSAQLFDEWALTLVDLGRTQDAIDRASKAMSLDSSFATTHVVLGDVLLESGNAEGALAEHRRALELDPVALTDAGLDRRVTRYLQLGHAQAFVDILRMAADKSGSRRAKISYAYVLSGLGQLPAAIAQYKALTTADKTDWLSWGYLALTFAKQGQLAEARNAAQMALRYVPADQSQRARGELSSILGPKSP